jgi:hypothetical protein
MSLTRNCQSPAESGGVIQSCVLTEYAHGYVWPSAQYPNTMRVKKPPCGSVTEDTYQLLVIRPFFAGVLVGSSFGAAQLVQKFQLPLGEGNRVAALAGAIEGCGQFSPLLPQRSVEV